MLLAHYLYLLAASLDILHGLCGASLGPGRLPRPSQLSGRASCSTSLSSCSSSTRSNTQAHTQRSTSIEHMYDAARRLNYGHNYGGLPDAERTTRPKGAAAAAASAAAVSADPTAHPTTTATATASGSARPRASTPQGRVRRLSVAEQAWKRDLVALDKGEATESGRHALGESTRVTFCRTLTASRLTQSPTWAAPTPDRRSPTPARGSVVHTSKAGSKRKTDWSSYVTATSAKDA